MMGRPTEYNEDILSSTKQYFESCNDVKDDKGNTLDVDLPSIEGLSYFLGIHKDTIYEWCKVHPDFSDVIGQLRSKQAKTLINKGLLGTYNPTIAKVLLTKHGYKDSAEIDHTSKGEKIGLTDEDKGKLDNIIHANAKPTDAGQAE